MQHEVLHYASRAKLLTKWLLIAKRLMSHGADVTANHNEAIWTVNKYKYPKVVELLKKHGATL